VVGIALVAMCGCGRFGFDATTSSDGPVVPVEDDAPVIDAAIGHDEDSDGIGDLVDLCPHLPDSTQGDADGDLVGDACDPDPAVAGQTWVRFSPFTPADTGFVPTGTWTRGADSWDHVDDGSASQLIATHAVSNVDVWMGFDITTIGPMNRQLAINVRQPGASSPYYYGELWEGSSGPKISVTYFDGSGYAQQSMQPVPGGAYPTGRGQLHIRARQTPAPDFKLDVSIAAGFMLTQTIPDSYVGGTRVVINAQNIGVSVRYVAIIATP